MAKMYGQYEVIREIGIGNSCRVYLGKHQDSGEEVAIKVVQPYEGLAAIEKNMCDRLQSDNAVGIPRIIEFNDNKDWLVLELLGPNLEELFNLCSRRFTLKTVLMLADQILDRIEYVHSKGIGHNSIKPVNFVMGLGENRNCVYLIDFGRSRISDINFQDWDFRRFACMLIYFLKGSEYNSFHTSPMFAMPFIKLCSGLPDEFAIFLKYILNLGECVAKDYAYVRQLFRNLFRSLGYTYDDGFDWIKISKKMKMAEDKAEKTVEMATEILNVTKLDEVNQSLTADTSVVVSSDGIPDDQPQSKPVHFVEVQSVQICA